MEKEAKFIIIFTLQESQRNAILEETINSLSLPKEVEVLIKL